LQNCNSSAYTVAGEFSPKKENYPPFMGYDQQNFRDVNARRLLTGNKDFTLDKVIELGYDRRLSAFELLIPALVKAVETTNTKTDYSYLQEPIKLLKEWDFRCGENSVATTLAIHYGEMIIKNAAAVKIPGNEKADMVERTRKYAAEGNPFEMISVFAAVYDNLVKKYGSWNIPWGQINRFQRISGNINSKFDDNQPSLPIGFVSSAWGALPAYQGHTWPGTQKRYGTDGNSFVCAVEFGKKIKAKSLLAGGENNDPKSPHFFDQGLAYTKGQFKDVLFYKEDLMKHVERKYHP
jgi:acyl-homoserine-lactone acylase